MSVNLSIKNVPDELAEQLRRRAESNHRSLQGELMALLEAALAPRSAEQSRRPYVVGAGEVNQEKSEVSLREIWADARRKGAGGGDSVGMIRDMREERGDHLMQLIEADGASARARELLGLPSRTAQPRAPASNRRPMHTIPKNRK